MEEVINFLESHQGSGVFSRPHIDFSSNFSRNLEFHLNKREKMDVVQLLQRQFIDYMKSLFMELVSKLTKHIVRTYQCSMMAMIIHRHSKGNRPAVVNRVPYASLLPQRDRSMVQGQDTYSSGDLFLLSLASF
ncbi:uncharacterized protein LOC104905818 isoform X9 [Beta vulgaris subsp. vulgaris]|uniref:uncharacterized protein LOC104905818 isoform X9 n=1 Tax=Beta vulgaris subsp. vulgaris TaxID=3555 RepID=UPI0025492DA3|nr:uncharacterized protein LOC104905818 isoform X9 [Beta vulgaris subsp. vulgaris]